MKKIFAFVLLAAALDAGAQSTARARPPGTAPLDEPPPPPAMIDDVDPALEKAERNTRIEGDNTITEYRVKGKVFMQRVTPKHGRSYVLMDHKGDGTFTRQDNTLDNGNRVPQWVLLDF